MVSAPVVQGRGIREGAFHVYHRVLPKRDEKNGENEKEPVLSFTPLFTVGSSKGGGGEEGKKERKEKKKERRGCCRCLIAVPTGGGGREEGNRSISFFIVHLNTRGAEKGKEERSPPAPCWTSRGKGKTEGEKERRGRLIFTSRPDSQGEGEKGK